MSKETGSFIKRLRTEKQMTQEDLAAKLGLKSAQAIESFESGHVLPDPEYLLRFSKIFSVPVEDFYVRIELDKRKNESKYVPLFSEKSLSEYIEGRIEEQKDVFDKHGLPMLLMSLYNKPKLPFRHIDPTLNGDLLFRVPNKYMAESDIIKDDLLIVDVFGFDVKEQREEFIGLIRLDRKIQVRKIIPYIRGDEKFYFIVKTPASQNILLDSDASSAIIGKVTGLIREYK